MSDYGSGLAAFSEILSGVSARRAGTAQKRALREQARATGIEARAAESALRRQTRRAFGELRAAGAQAGVAGSVTFGDVYAQSAAEAELDALNIRYQGTTARSGLLYDAKMAKALRPTWGQIGISAGARALSGGASSFAQPRQQAPVTTSQPTYTRGR